MSKSKYTNMTCIAIAAAMLLITATFMSGVLPVTAAHKEPAYAARIFDNSVMHTIDIIVAEADWAEMLANAQNEEYIQCSVVIDGETLKGVGIRPKGNSSLSTIARSDSDRYSFKVEFDHYSGQINYYGLDKLVLNNIAQDNTYMKDYVTYQMMNAMGADAPLTSFIWVTVNGEDWGLYLAAESIEESFASRVYGNDYGQIYKPDTMDLNNRDNWDNNGENGGIMPDFENGEMPDFGNMPGFENGEFPEGMPDFGGMPNRENGGQPGVNREMPEGMPNAVPGGNTNLSMPIEGGNANPGVPAEGGTERRADRGNAGGFGGGGFGGNSAVSLVYTDDDPENYAAIFDNAAFKISDDDKTRLIDALKRLGEGDVSAVDVDKVLRYFAVHNFVLNSDSYTGSMIHNYYLYEKDGQLSMIAWDYNLAFGGMGMGGGFGGMGGMNSGTTSMDSATTMVNYPMDSPLLSGTFDEKPMIKWIFENEEYLAQYHEIMAEYVEYFNSGEFIAMYDATIALISPYVEKDPTSFCTYEDFQKGQAALKEFCLLRAESISGQLDGTIASTSEAQAASKNAGFIDASSVDISSMGSSSMGFGMARGGNRQNNR